MSHLHRAQQGFAAIAAIFLVVILAALGAFMVSISNTQQINSAQDLQGSRAYWAARAGLEWAVASLPAGSTACWATTPPSVIEGFNVTVTCAVNSYSEGLASVTIFKMVATAKTGGSVGSFGYVERSVTATLER